MHKNDHTIRDYCAILDAEYGKPGSPQRIEALEKAYAFYKMQIIEDARKKAK